MFADAFAVFVKFFFILTPFFIVAVFIAMTENETVEVRHKLAVRITLAVIAISLILFFCRSNHLRTSRDYGRRLPHRRRSASLPLRRFPR